MLVQNGWSHKQAFSGLMCTCFDQCCQKITFDFYTGRINLKLGAKMQGEEFDRSSA